MNDFKYDELCITLYMLDIENEDDALFYQHLSGLQVNIISVNQENNIDLNTVDNTVLKSLTNRPNMNTKERKIGNTTFIISSKVKENKPCDLVSKIVRLINYENETVPYIYGLNGGY